MIPKNKLKDFTKEEYLKLLNSGMFWELYPEASGFYEKDVFLSKQNKFKIENDTKE